MQPTLPALASLLSRIPKAVAAQRAELQRLLEAYYALDYEDEVAGLKTRFRYRQVRRLAAWLCASHP
jgi:hypothetical protein